MLIKMTIITKSLKYNLIKEDIYNRNQMAIIMDRIKTKIIDYLVSNLISKSVFSAQKMKRDYETI